MDMRKTSTGMQASTRKPTNLSHQNLSVREAVLSEVTGGVARSSMPKSGSVGRRKRARTRDGGTSLEPSRTGTSFALERQPPSTNTTTHVDSLPPESEDHIFEDDELSTTREAPQSDTVVGEIISESHPSTSSGLTEAKRIRPASSGPTFRKEVGTKRKHPMEPEDPNDKGILSDRQSGIQVTGQFLHVNKSPVNVGTVKTRPKTRGASRKPVGQKKAKAGQLVFACVRSLVRLGVLPIISAPDDTFLMALHAVVQHHDKSFPTIVGSKTTDPYFPVRSEDNSVPTAVSQLPVGYMKRLQKSLDVCPALVKYIRGPMCKMATKLLGPDTLKHVTILASSFDALERLKNNTVRALLINSWTPDEQQYPDVRNWNLRDRCIVGAKLLCIIYAGLLAIYRQGWNSCTSIQLSYEKLLPSFYNKAKDFRLGWNNDSIRALMFEPSPVLNGADPKSLDISHIGSHYERYCTVYLTAVMNVSQSEQNALQNINYDLNESVTRLGGHLDTHPLTETIEEAAQDVCNNSEPAGVNTGTEGNDEPAPWNVPVGWASYKSPIHSTVNGQSTVFTAYERDISRVDKYKKLLMKCRPTRIPICDDPDKRNMTVVDALIASMIELAGYKDQPDMEDIRTSNTRRRMRDSIKEIDEAEEGHISLVDQWMAEDEEFFQSLQSEKED